MSKIFLIGGGWRAETFPETYKRFLSDATRGGKRRIAIVVAEEPDANVQAQFLRFFEAFEKVGLNSNEAFEIIVSKENFLTKEKLETVKPTGIFVCGGLTPAYSEALCVDQNWLEYLLENEIPYCGFSAGAAIASNKAIIGGWQREIDNKIVQIADENAGEDLDLLAVRDGLNLVDFSIDVHATEWGTLSRLVHAVDAGFCGEGLAIDENTMIEFADGKMKVFGAGNVYRIAKKRDEISIKIFQSDD